ncbi:glycoside hydrolase family 25 protein [Ruminococcus sp.]|uniref:glycoside hydrolase family 25 protein n=1 Tax=Ruminococcus sp. TaxID=41978 RepID=UPI00386B0A0D
MAKINCVDVSEFQQGIDFSKMSADGIKAVIIRAGYGKEVSQKDTMFESHYKGAKSAGLKIGVYWYSYANSADDAEREAKACLECIKGKSLDMPIYYDMEDSSQIKLGKTKLTEIAERFCETIKKSGYRAGVYANLNWFSNYLNYGRLKSKYSIWLAQYNDENQLACDIWQNSSTGRVSGYNGNIDTNIIYNESIFSDKTEKPTEEKNYPAIYYKVRCGGIWLPEVKNLEDYAGLKGKAITDIAIRVSTGKVWYQVHTKGGWLPKVTGYDIDDFENGYAGNGSNIDAIRVYYTTPQSVANSLGKYLVAKYRVSPINKEYFDWQKDDQTTNGQDGYAGLFDKSIDRVSIILE